MSTPSSEWIPAAALLGLYLGSLLYSLFQGWHQRRLYWLGCALLLVAGLLLMLLAEPAASDAGEMPPGFGLGAWVAALGILATAAGALTRRWRARRG
ncbi:hypothetical protein [Chromobacterium violaceum]|uniref:Uncharacterized protein n=1 Tax=Chromobacterium violaceum TaxID=536 RepID=A0AAX2MDC3_CHRVL|nr:hypothetical protein [Chromobacterium violaceum]MBX9266138.1 hypothetical protein [Chromobacterium violaceum]OLZ81097.1 hypothetical protein BS642_09070 [Chromobacterium violaceum]STB70337.1 Uncharacterised protein [Chromobacterium violaceum]SUX34987.1 Uncharacterised protein [Chromobacterium violaceum]